MFDATIYTDGTCDIEILAAGGIGFGVWAMLDGNQKVAELNQEVADLRSKILTTTSDDADNKGDWE